MNSNRLNPMAKIFGIILLMLIAAGVNAQSQEEVSVSKIEKTDEQWKKELTPEQYRVLRKKGTESAFTGEYVHNKQKGKYKCAACGTELFASETKFESGTGWPSFTAPLSPDRIGYEHDTSYGMERTEVHCPVCGGHLGHVFDDGPAPSGKRFCINSASLKFSPEGEKE